MKVLNSLSRWMGYVSSVAIIIMMLVVTADVIGRYVFNSPIMGASELARFLMIVIVFPVMAWVALEGKHVKVDFIVDRFPRLVQVIIDSLGLLLALGMYSILTWRSVLASMEVNNVTSMIRLPHAPFYWTMTVGWAVFCVAIIVLLISNIAKAVKK